MTLTREPVPSREQVIAWVEAERTRRVCRADYVSQMHTRHDEWQREQEAIANLAAILTHLQSAEIRTPLLVQHGRRICL